MSDSIKPTTSSDIATTRLRAMKEHAVITNVQSMEKQIPNPYPADNNKMWNGYHNDLSSKGDS